MDKNMPRAVPQKKSRHAYNDRISQLPDHLLLFIFSFLTVKDAVVACMVSTRWKNLWMENIWRWNLEVPEKERVRYYKGENAARHTEIVNRALKSHSGPYLEELRIGAYGSPSLPDQVFGCINFAILKGVKIFELKIDPAGFGPMSLYNFPRVDYLAKFLDHQISEKELHHSCRVHPEKHQFRSFCCLKSLSLGHLNVSEEIIYYFFSSCMFLEHLRVELSESLLNLEVADGLRLKCLEIVYCFKFKSLKIYTRNLESLVYIGPNIDVPFQKAPLNCLQLTIGFKFGESFASELDKHSFYLSQLKRLKFQVPYKAHTFFCREPREFPEMINLRHLELQVPISKSLLGYMMFFTASPFLSTFKIEYRLRRSFTETEVDRAELEICDKRHEARIVPHEHLQKVELIGFYNDPADVRLALNLINMAVSLKTMVLKFRHRSASQAAFRNVRKKFAEALPAGAELVLMKT